MNNRLPVTITYEVFSYLAVHDFFSFGKVSRATRALIQSYPPTQQTLFFKKTLDANLLTYSLNRSSSEIESFETTLDFKINYEQLCQLFFILPRQLKRNLTSVQLLLLTGEEKAFSHIATRDPTIPVTQNSDNAKRLMRWALISGSLPAIKYCQSFFSSDYSFEDLVITDEYSALLYAARVGNKPLLQHGIRELKLSIHSRTASTQKNIVQLALTFQHLTIVTYILTELSLSFDGNCDDWTPLLEEAIKKEDIDLLRYLNKLMKKNDLMIDEHAFQFSSSSPLLNEMVRDIKRSKQIWRQYRRHANESVEALEPAPISLLTLYPNLPMSIFFCALLGVAPGMGAFAMLIPLLPAMSTFAQGVISMILICAGALTGACVGALICVGLALAVASLSYAIKKAHAMIVKYQARKELNSALPISTETNNNHRFFKPTQHHTSKSLPRLTAVLA